MRKQIKSNVSWDELFMRHVYLIASKSKDPRTKVGAVLVKDNVVVSEGYNGFARGVRDYKERYDDRELKYKFVVHAELNTVLNAAGLGRSVSNTTCYTQEVPCHECTKALIQAGVTKIIVHDGWPCHGGPWKESVKISHQMLREAGIILMTMDIYLNVDAYADGKIFKV